MKRTLCATTAGLALATLAAAAPAPAQTWATNDPVLKRMWAMGMDESQVPRLSQQLMDSIGPRLTGSPGLRRANDWALKTLTGFGVQARNEQYGTWRGWERGVTHIDLVQPRVRTLEGTMMAWSPGTKGKNLQGSVVVVPEYRDEAALDAWIKTTKGKFVAISFPQPTCRPDRQYEEFGQPGALERLKASRDSAQKAFRQRVASAPLLRLKLEAAGALGTVESLWSGDYGVNKVFATNTTTMPSVDLSCEDYGLVYRLSENDQGPVVRLNSEARFTGEAPVFNTIGEIRGTEKPNEYVLLSAHFDSWDAGSGATDNGTGTVTMLEAMRILKQAYPNPKRTILIGLWGGEEQGLNGSRRFVGMHPDIVEGLQASFNQDNGTGRVVNIGMQGLTGAAPFMARWLTPIPREITRFIELDIPGMPSGGSSDYASFVCSGAPGFSLSSLGWGYGTYTWHTNRDTYDKVVMEDVKNNAVLTAMLAYMASEDPDRLPRDRRVLPLNREGQQMQWPNCQPGRANSGTN